ncbi:MAG: hypothetical protein WCH99_17000 [Verrucomicrobiota bacterium]
MLIIEANYSKKLGLPGYSSHQYSVTLRAEIADLAQVSAKSQELHQLMQSCVDREIQQTGFLPGEVVPVLHVNGNGHTNGNGHHRSIKPAEEPWQCSTKQRDLILKITDEQKLDKNQVEQLAQDRFGKGVRALNKLEASGLIEELLEQTGQSKPRNQRFQKGGAR